MDMHKLNYFTMDAIALAGAGPRLANASIVIQPGNAWVEHLTTQCAWKVTCDARKTAAHYVLERSAAP